MWRLLIFFLVAFIILKASTFGWRFFGKSYSVPTDRNNNLVENLKSHVWNLAHEIGDRSLFKYEALQKASCYITDAFISIGYDVEFQTYNTSGKTVKNIIATKIGVERPKEVIIVGAHYDTCFNPGADDNASSVAGLLEMARLVFSQQTNRSIRFVAFVNEEPPFFKTENMGSCVYVREAKAKGENIKATLILEMIGYYTNKSNSQQYPPFLGLFYPNKGNFICIVGNWRSRRLVKKIVSKFKSQSKFPIESFIGTGFVPGVDFSDHWSFWKEGYLAVMITDTAFYRNPYYHTSSDTYEKLNYLSLAEVVRGLATVLIKLAK